MKAQFIFQHLNESKGKMFEPEYFKLPYQIPENRFEKGLLKSSTARKGTTPRKINVNSNTKYKDLQDYAKRVNLAEVNAQIKSDVLKIMKFISLSFLPDGAFLLNCLPMTSASLYANTAFITILLAF